MAHETTSQATTTAPAEQAATPEPAAPEQTVSADAPSEAQATTKFDPLFDTESVSEAELRGEEPPKADAPPEPTPKPSETKEAGSSPPKDGKDEQPTEKATDEPGDAGKPPKGFVSIKALHQERGQRQILSQELSRVRTELEQLRAGQKASPESTPAAEAVKEEPGFKVLSEAEFDALVEDDPVEAIKYDRKLRVYEAKQAQRQQAEQSENAVIEESIGMMAGAIPGLYDEASDINQRLSDFAVSNGFTDIDGLALVTDPRTKVIPANGGKPQPLGQAAAHLVLMLNNLFQAASKSPDVKQKIEQSVREQVTKEVLSKIKQPSGAEHRSLGDIPGDAGDTAAPPTVLTEADFARLSEADQRRLLGG